MKLLDVGLDLYNNIEPGCCRTLHVDSLVQDLMELAKAQHSHLIRTVSHNTNMVVTLAKDSSDANKQLHYNITQLANYFQVTKRCALIFFKATADKIYNLCTVLPATDYFFRQ